NDFGIMLLEMWAYVCDSIAFYDEVIADECYVRTASQRQSLRKLVGLLGYVPRPAIAASVELAVIAAGRQPVLLPAGTQFRSGAIIFDSVHRDIQLNDWVVLDNAGDRRAFRVRAMAEVQATLPGAGAATVKDSSNHVTSTVDVTSRIPVTAILLDAPLNDPS